MYKHSRARMHALTFMRALVCARTRARAHTHTHTHRLLNIPVCMLPDVIFSRSGMVMAEPSASANSCRHAKHTHSYTHRATDALAAAASLRSRWPDWPKAWFRSGRALECAKRPRDALRMFAAAWRLEPGVCHTVCITLCVYMCGCMWVHSTCVCIEDLPQEKCTFAAQHSPYAHLCTSPGGGGGCGYSVSGNTGVNHAGGSSTRVLWPPSRAWMRFSSL